MKKVTCELCGKKSPNCQLDDQNDSFTHICLWCSRQDLEIELDNIEYHYEQVVKKIEDIEKELKVT